MGGIDRSARGQEEDTTESVPDSGTERPASRTESPHYGYVDQTQEFEERAKSRGYARAAGPEVGAAGKRHDRVDSSPSEERQRALGEELAQSADARVDQEINEALDKINPKFDWTESAYSENCTSVVQANELRRRGHDVQAGPLEEELRKDQGGPGGRAVGVIEQVWGREFVAGTRTEIEEAFQQPGARGVVAIEWKDGGGYVFNVENVGGNVRFVDGQPDPPVEDASHYFDLGHNTWYARLDDRPDPSSDVIRPYLEP